MEKDREYLREEHLKVVLEELREAIRSQGPESVAARAGVDYQGDDQTGLFQVSFWGQNYVVSYPQLRVKQEGGEAAGRFERGILLYYLRGCPDQDRDHGWLTLRELPGGRFYGSAFQGYSGDVLAREMGSKPEELEKACLALGGKPEPLGDLGFSFQVLPRVRVAVAVWLGDSEFPPRATVLFEGSSTLYIPTDALAGVGSRVARRIREYRSS